MLKKVVLSALWSFTNIYFAKPFTLRTGLRIISHSTILKKHNSVLQIQERMHLHHEMGGHKLRSQRQLFALNENSEEASMNSFVVGEDENIKDDVANLQKQVDSLRAKMKSTSKVEEFRIKKKSKKEETKTLEELDRLEERLSAFESNYELSRFQLQSKELVMQIKEVWVLLYNVGTNDEGIYSLSLGDANVVLGWECKKEAQTYAMMLKAQEWFVPQAHRMPTQEMLAFCDDNGHQFEVVPRGSGFTPPEANKENLDYDPTQVEQPKWKPAVSCQDPEIFSAQDLEDIRSDLNNLLDSTGDSDV